MPLPSEQTRLRLWLQSRLPTRKLNCFLCEKEGSWEHFKIHPQRPDSFGMVQYLFVCDTHGTVGFCEDIDCYQDPAFSEVTEVIRWRSK